MVMGVGGPRGGWKDWGGHGVVGQGWPGAGWGGWIGVAVQWMRVARGCVGWPLGLSLAPLTPWPPGSD